MNRLATPDEVVAFWREAGPERWFEPDEAFDALCRERFLLTHEAAARGDLNEWELSPEGALAVVLLLAFAGYLAALHVGGYRSLSGGSTDPVLTGRYLIVLLPLVGAAVAVTASWLPRRATPVAGAVAVFGSLALHFAALGALMVRFHAFDA